MADTALIERVRELRRQGRAPKEIARALKLTSAAVPGAWQHCVIVCGAT